MTSTLVLWRHGLTDWNAQGRFQGQADIPLNQTGVEQAVAVAPAIAALAPASIHCSPLRRARRTAQELSAVTGLDLSTDPRLMEIDVGSWAGLTLAEAGDLDPDFPVALRADQDHRRSPEGETAVEVGLRMGECLREIAAAHRGEVTAVVSHGLAIRMGTASLLGWPYSSAARLAGMVNCGWTVLTGSGDRWRLQVYNASLVKAIAGANADA